MPKLPNRRGERHVLMDFDQWKQHVNLQVELNFGNSGKYWCAAFTSRTRVHASESWLAATTRNNVRRALYRSFGKDISFRKSLEHKLAVSMQQAAWNLGLFDSRCQRYLSVDDLFVDSDLLSQFVVGTMDKARTSGFIA